MGKQKILAVFQNRTPICSVYPQCGV